MSTTHGQIRLRPKSILITEGGRCRKAQLFLPPDPRGTVIFGGAPNPSRSDHALLLDSLVDSRLGVLLLPRLRTRNAEAQLRLMQAARTWVNAQPWLFNVAQGLLGCGLMAAPVLDLAGRPENMLRAVAVYEGSPEMSEANLDAVRVPTLFVTSSEHPQEEEFNREMTYCLRCECKMVVLDKVLVHPRVVAEWFIDHFGAHADAGGEAPWQGDSGSKPFSDLAPVPA